MRGCICALIPFVLMTGSLAQIEGADTLFGPADLSYFSALERESFSQYFDGRPDFLKMIVAVNANSHENEPEMYREWISDMVREIRNGKFERLNETKKINQIINSVSRSLLTSFEHQAGFSDLFRYGRYNYFTAASLYAFILDQLDIPHEIREVPTGISVLAYPDDQQITVEIDGPGSQYFMFAHDTRSNFVEFLRESDALDDATFALMNTRTLFEQYYFADYGLTIREMIGMLYLNSAIDYLNRSEPENAYAQFEKAFILYPSYKIQYLLLAHLNSFLTAMDYHNPRDLGYLVKASRLIGFGMDREMIVTLLKGMIHEGLIKEQDLKGMQYIFDYIQDYLADELSKKEFNFLYHYETGRLYFNEQQYPKALESFESAYSLKPDDKNNQDLLIRSLGGYTINANPGMVMEKLQLYDTAFPEITKQEIYLATKQQVCLDFFGEAFQLQDGKNGEYYMAIFEEIADRYPNITVNQLAVGRSYSSAAIYYYRQGRVQKSREILEKGLTYAPHNTELKLKLKTFE